MPKIYWQFICPQLSRVVELARQILKAAGILLKTSRKMLSYFCLKRDQRKYFCGLSMDTRIARCCTNAVPTSRKVCGTQILHPKYLHQLPVHFIPATIYLDGIHEIHPKEIEPRNTSGQNIEAQHSAAKIIRRCTYSMSLLSFSHLLRTCLHGNDNRHNQF